MVPARSAKAWFFYVFELRSFPHFLSFNIYGTVLTLREEQKLPFMKIIKSSLFMLLASTAIFFACKKENSSQTSTLKVRMTDAPAAWDEVNVDLQQVRVNFRDDSSGWVNLQTNAGVYNLLNLQNGVDTLIAQGSVQTGMVKEIRLVLGSNNTIKVNGVTFPLTIPSGSESGLKIKVNKNLTSSLDSLLIDFDAALSIKEQNGSYKLMPVIKLK
jgi:hypothetical protein